MQIGRVKGATRVLGKSQGYMGLPLRDDTINCTVGGEGTPCMTTAWLPTPKELEALNAGDRSIAKLCVDAELDLDCLVRFALAKLATDNR